MSDYKELIGDIGDLLIAHPSEILSKRYLKSAADAIEQLVKERDELYMEVMDCTKKIGCKAIEQVKKERDAAVEDLNVARSCLTCKSDGLDFCEGCDSWASKRNWEWRGVQE